MSTALLIFTLLIYAGAIAAIVCLYVYYTGSGDCVLNKVLISLNLIFCVIVSVVSILPKIQVKIFFEQKKIGSIQLCVFMEFILSPKLFVKVIRNRVSS